MGSMSLNIKVITATGVIVPSFRMPAGIYLSINYTTTTSVKALLYDNNVVWDETVNLTSVPHTGLTIELRAAFESVTMVGRGELIRKIETSPDFLASHGDDPFDIVLLAHTDEKLQNVPVVTLKVSFCTVPTGTELSHALLDTSSALLNPIAEFDTISVDYDTIPADFGTDSGPLDFIDNFETISADFGTDRASLDSIVEQGTHIYTPQLFESDGTIAQDTDDGHAHFAAYMAGHAGSRLKNALECFERVLLKCPEGHDARAAALSNLAWAQLTAVVHNHSKDVHSIIPLFREAVKLRPLGHPDQALSMFHLALALNHLHEIKELDIDIWECAAVFYTLLRICPVSTYMYRSVVTGRILGDVIRKCNGLPIFSSDHDVTLRQMVVMLCPPGHDRRVESLEMLSRTLCAHGGIDAIEESICHRRELVSMHPVGHINRYKSLNRLAHSLNCRLTLSGEFDNHEEITELCNESLRLNPAVQNREEVTGLLNSLGVVLARRFIEDRDMNRIDNALVVFRSAQALCPDSENGLYMLVLALLTRGSKEDFIEAIKLSSETRLLELGSYDNPEHGLHVVTLRTVFNNSLTRFRAEGMTDLAGCQTPI